MSLADVLVLIPVVPVLPVIATWWLPWERWVPKLVPKYVLGPYLLYCSFASWYFKGGWWTVGIVAAMGACTCVIAILDWRNRRLLLGAQEWPSIEGRIIAIEGEPNNDGSETVTVTYSYSIEGDLHVGSEFVKFRRKKEAERFKGRFVDGKIQVHYRPDSPDVSAPHVTR